MVHSTLSESETDSIAGPASNHWHTLMPQQAIALLETSPQGLSPSEAEHRQQVYGLNELQEGAIRSPLAILWDQFKNIMLLLLIAVALVLLMLDLRQGGISQRRDRDFCDRSAEWRVGLSARK